jgi:DNA-binding response OmpR family regulator
VRILVVDDEVEMASLIARGLTDDGHETVEAHDGIQAMSALAAGGVDLAVVDVMLPGLDGIGLCRKVREGSLTPILMMSARGDALDVVSGLEAGADDYVVKPVDTSVLVARIRSLLRRASFVPGPEPTTDVAFGELTIDPQGLEVRRSGELLALAPTELRLLLEFAANPGIVLDRQTLLRNVWDYGWDGDSRVVDLCVQRLRKKIGPDLIETVRGFGYKLRR